MNTLGTSARSLLAALSLALAALGASAQDGVSKGSIVIGQSIVQAGIGASIARPYYEGAKLYFDRVNAGGGVNGRKLDLVTLEDNGRSVTTVANTKKLLERGVFCLFGYYGSTQVAAAYPLIKDSDVVLFAPMTAADEFRGPAYPNVYSLRPGFSEEAAAITRHAQTLGARKLAIIHASDAESLEALASAERTMTKMGATLVAKAATSGGSVANAVDTALAAKPESLLVIGDANSAAGVVRDVRAKGFRGAIYGFSNTGESLLAEELGPAGAGVVVVRVVPKTENPTSVVARELQADAAAAKAGKPNVYMLEGYIAARVLVEALRRIPGEPTRAKFKRSLDSLRDFDVGNFRADLSRDRVASHLVELALIDSQGRVRE
jgi:ABC-type branched-subunit amino acid transport system substrate-binding protein